MQIKYYLRKLEVKIRQIAWSVKRSLEPTTYDSVTYKGMSYYIKSSYTGHNKWNLFDSTSQKPIFTNVKGKELKVKHSFRRFVDVVKRHMYFQKSNWESIDCNKNIGSRLSYNNSNDIKF